MPVFIDWLSTREHFTIDWSLVECSKLCAGCDGLQSCCMRWSTPGCVLWLLISAKPDLHRKRKPLINKKYELSLVYSNESHQIAAKAYFDWWENNKQKNFYEFKNIDPLKFTDYRWH